MGQQIIRQPNGLFAIFSSNTDTINVWDAADEEVLQHFVEQAIADTRRQVSVLLEHVKAGNPREAYYQFALTWEEALRMDREHGGTIETDYQAERQRDPVPSERVDPQMIPAAVCSVCGRYTWQPANSGTVCGMPQPDGGNCIGVFGPGVAP